MKSRNGRSWERGAHLGKVAETVAGRLLKQFPFRILGFHSDNGSEFVNHSVAGVAEQAADRADEIATAELQRQRPCGIEERRGNPQTYGLRSYASSRRCGQINVFYEEHFNPYLNFHRPCGVPELKKDSKGKTVRTYKWYATPWEILRQLPGMGGWLKDDITVEHIERMAGADSDTGAATKMRAAKPNLFAGFQQRKIA